jgi:carbonic anhydrase/acetyltransferase-like protein (isoleucine patch superfamily)
MGTLYAYRDKTPSIGAGAVLFDSGAMIHGCHIGRGSIVEPGAIVCDGSVVGAESVVRAGACVKQRDRLGDRSILEGFPAGREDIGPAHARPSGPARQHLNQPVGPARDRPHF